MKVAVKGKAPQRGFTLIELLVVISIIGILASLILPAVVNARRQGRRVQCLNNMTNIGKGMFSYVTQKNQFPASGYWDVTTASNEAQDSAVKGVSGSHPNQLLIGGWSWNSSSTILTSSATASAPETVASGSNGTAGLKYSWVVEVLPFIGSQNLYDAWDFSGTTTATAPAGGNRGWYLDNTPGTAKRGNSDLANTYLELLVCPEDVTSQQSQGSISYVVNGGFAPHWIAAISTDPSTSVVQLRQVNGGSPNPNQGGGWHRDNLRNMGLMFLDTTTGGTEAHRRHTLESVRDGASFTAMLSENINVGPGSQYGGMGIISNWACPFPLNTSFFVNPVSVFGGDPISGESISVGANAGVYNYVAANTRGSLAPPVTSDGNQGGINGDITGINEGQFPYPNSMHPGGVHVVMCDGNVRFIPENISGEVWARLITPNGGALQWGNASPGTNKLNFESAPSGNPSYLTGNRQVPLSEGDIPSG